MEQQGYLAQLTKHNKAGGSHDDTDAANSGQKGREIESRSARSRQGMWTGQYGICMCIHRLLSSRHRPAITSPHANR